jgi:hypothetical protein
MNDKEFSELQLRAAIVPQQVRWPAPDFVHWQRLHEVVNEARHRVTKAYMQMDEIDRNTALSREGKELQRRKTAAQAVADFAASKTLVRAREAVESAVTNHNLKAQARDAALEAMKQADRGWRRAIDKIAERVSVTKGPYTRQ